MSTRLKVIIALIMASLTLAEDNTISDLQPCSIDDCEYRWNLYTIMTDQKYLEFREANATVTIFDAKFQLSSYLQPRDPWAIFPLIYETPETLPEDSYCLQVIGGDKSTLCQNPAHISTMRQSGTYCFDTMATPSYYPYIFTQTDLVLFFKLNYTVELDSGPLAFSFDCNSVTHECLGNTSMPWFEFSPILDSWISFTQFTLLPVLGKYLFVPTSPLFPYTPLPLETIIVDSNVQYPTVLSTPDCFKTEGAHSWQNTTSHLLTSGLALQLSEIGLNASTASLRLTPPSTILQMLIEGSMGNSMLVDLRMIIPKRSFVPSSLEPSPDSI